tara:strand:- start:197 stop:532 length:336 start_codon:yes stop_codon:yes gene_type:complete
MTKKTKKRSDMAMYVDEVDQCIKAFDVPVREMCEKFPPNVVMASMLEVSLRMFLLATGSAGVLKIFSGCVSNVSTMGPLVDAMLAAGQTTDPLNFKEFANLNIVPEDETLH